MKILMPFAATLLTTTLFQAPTTPPMKLGLWEATVTSTVKQADGTDKTTSRLLRNCVTKENWLTLMGPTTKNACPKANEVWTKDSYSFDVTCSGKPKTGTVTIHFDTPETEHGSLDISAMPDGTPVNMHVTFTDHWVSAACGDVSPDHPVVVVR
jgi:hypothetical protein